jgi:hypothetical protein
VSYSSFLNPNHNHTPNLPIPIGFLAPKKQFSPRDMREINHLRGNNRNVVISRQRLGVRQSPGAFDFGSVGRAPTPLDSIAFAAFTRNNPSFQFMYMDFDLPDALAIVEFVQASSKLGAGFACSPPFASPERRNFPHQQLTPTPLFSHKPPICQICNRHC